MRTEPRVDRIELRATSGAGEARPRPLGDAPDAERVPALEQGNALALVERLVTHGTHHLYICVQKT